MPLVLVQLTKTTKKKHISNLTKLVLIVKAHSQPASGIIGSLLRAALRQVGVSYTKVASKYAKSTYIEDSLKQMISIIEKLDEG